MCMEHVSHLIEQKCVAGSWVPLKAFRGNLDISHLLFADDIILFKKVEVAKCEAMKEVLEKFCSESSKKISVEKSRIYFSANVSDNAEEKICEILGIQATRNIGKYLSFPIIHRGASTRQYNFIAKKVINKLAGWKAKFLSFAGQAVLIKFVCLSSPTM